VQEFADLPASEAEVRGRAWLGHAHIGHGRLRQVAARWCRVHVNTSLGLQDTSIPDCNAWPSAGARLALPQPARADTADTVPPVQLPVSVLWHRHHGPRRRGQRHHAQATGVQGRERCATAASGCNCMWAQHQHARGGFPPRAPASQIRLLQARAGRWRRSSLWTPSAARSWTQYISMQSSLRSKVRADDIKLWSRVGLRLGLSMLRC